VGNDSLSEGTIDDANNTEHLILDGAAALAKLPDDLLGPIVDYLNSLADNQGGQTRLTPYLQGDRIMYVKPTKKG